MTVYPQAIDSDNDIIRIDDNITELGGTAINQCREAIFAIETALGISPNGSKTSVSDRLAVSLNDNGTIKASALMSIGLVTLPIIDNQVASNAGIKEFKLALDHKTSDLYTIIVANKSLLDAVNTFVTLVNANFLAHLAGATHLSNGETSARHVASQIDLNAIPEDFRDPFFTWGGLKDKQGLLRSATQVAAALQQINADLVNHENATNGAHTAQAIEVDTDFFTEIPPEANTAQKVFDYLDRAEELNIGEHRATQHANGIPSIARSQSITGADGYGRDNIVPTTTVNAYLSHPPANGPEDQNTVGDDLIKFIPNNTNFIFDSQFSLVRVGDIVRINYGNGLSAQFEVESFRFIPGQEWVVRINGINLADAVDGYVDGYNGIATARIDRPRIDPNTNGVLALASANSIPSNLYPTLLGSVIVGHPRGATALGIGFDGNKLNANHYRLWLQLYPTGNPAESSVTLPFIDVTGDAGASPGSYTLEKVVAATNNAFRRIGYNYRFIAFTRGGNFGIMLADPVGNASFAILNGSNGSGTVLTDIYIQNVVADASDGDGSDAFGLGSGAAQLASPAYQATFLDSTSAQHPTVVITPARRRFYVVDGNKLDGFAPTYLTQDGYWNASIVGKTSTGSSIEVTYQVDLDLRPAKLKAGKTILVQPSVALNDGRYSIVDYGRFIIKQVNFSQPCNSEGSTTTITVINGIHATGLGIAGTSNVGLPVRLYFGEDSVSFNDTNVIDSALTAINYHRYHEIYINNSGKTFSHERARMQDDQLEGNPANPLLRSDNWHIEHVSPKLRGYRDNINTFNKYLRFYVTRYDATSGEFDGYVGRRVPSGTGITNAGPLVTSRKNVTTRFYDESYIDFIELEFTELASGPNGIPILSDSTPRYLDIEIFPTLRLDSENFLLGSCEINWTPASGQLIVQKVQDLRSFGSIGPEDLNTETLDFLTRSDSFLHENGVFRGFQYIPGNTTNTTGKLFFTGGSAMVDGFIVTANESSVTIPQISNAGATGVTVTWAVCVDRFGNLVPIVLTPTKTQFFAGTTQAYYVESVTFDELINKRKDLTIVATVDAHIASITINDSDVNDLRRFLNNSGANTSLVLTQDEKVGHFHSFAAVKQWVNRTDSYNNHITVRGTWEISTPIDLTGFNKKVILESDGAQFNIHGTRGFLVGSNLTLKNFTFNYFSPSVSPLPGDLVATGDGLLYSLGSISNFHVIGCSFISNLSTPRHPYIDLEIDIGLTLQDCTFIGNSFQDSSASEYSAAIAIVSLNASNLSTRPAIVNRVKISENVCNLFQGFIISTPSGLIIRPGINIVNTIISDNYCGYIGYWSVAIDNNNLSPTLPNNGLIIRGNTCHFIETAMATGRPINEEPPPNCGFGSVIVESNQCNWIHLSAQDGAASGNNTEFSSTIVKSNILTGYDFTGILDPFFTENVTTNAAIFIAGNPLSSQNDYSTVLITDNQIGIGVHGGITYKYVNGIHCQIAGTIANNIIKGFVLDTSGGIPGTLDGYGILITRRGSSTGVRNYIITHNHIYRGSDTIMAYVGANISEDVPTSGMVVENIFDSTTVDGSSTVVTVTPASWIVQRNKNQTITQIFDTRNGAWSFNTVMFGPPTSGTSTIMNSQDSPNQVFVNYNNANISETATWKIPLLGVVPTGVTIIGIGVTAVIGSTAPSTRTITLKLKTTTTDTTTATLISTPLVFQINPAPTFHIVVPDSSGASVPEVILSTTVDFTDAIQITLTNFFITYKW